MTGAPGRSRRRALPLIAVLLLTVGLAATGQPAGADGNEAPGAPATFRSISGGDGFSCGLLVDGTVKCWGEGLHGQLGQGDTTNWGDLQGQLGGELPTIALGTGRTALAITAGSSHACVLLDDHTVKCWGDNFY